MNPCSHNFQTIKKEADITLYVAHDLQKRLITDSSQGGHQILGNNTQYNLQVL